MNSLNKTEKEQMREAVKAEYGLTSPVQDEFINFGYFLGKAHANFKHSTHMEDIKVLQNEVAELRKLASAISKDCNDTALQRNFVQGQLSTANAAIAMKDEALTSAKELLVAIMHERRPLQEINDEVEAINDALSNTRATADQFVSECEKRGAVKALEWAQHKKHCYVLDIFDSDKGCTCGLDKFRATLKKG